MMSDGVIVPGSSGNPLFFCASISAGVSPGLTPNTAPADFAASKSSGREIVPTPTIASLTFDIRPIASSPCAVRSGTSNARTPPATSASASGTASSIRSMMITGITGPTRITSMVFIASTFRKHELIVDRHRVADRNRLGGLRGDEAHRALLGAERCCAEHAEQLAAETMVVFAQIDVSGAARVPFGLGDQC